KRQTSRPRSRLKTGPHRHAANSPERTISPGAGEKQRRNIGAVKKRGTGLTPSRKRSGPPRRRGGTLREVQNGRDFRKGDLVFGKTTFPRVLSLGAGPFSLKHKLGRVGHEDMIAFLIPSDVQIPAQEMDRRLPFGLARQGGGHHGGASAGTAGQGLTDPPLPDAHVDFP